MTRAPIPRHAGQAPGERDHRIPSLDGVRAISIALVLLAHASGTAGFPHAVWALLRPFDYGNLGVRVFFVISGYLITTLLLRERASTGRIGLGRFYLRRFFRIFPAYYVYIAAIAVLATAGWVAPVPRAVLAHALSYTVNYSAEGTWATAHFWSLSVEEQFYLLWPFILVSVGVASGARAALAFVVAAPFIRLALYALVPSWRPVIGASFETVGDTIAIGCLLACWRGELWLRPWYRRLLTARWFAFVVPIVLAATTVIGSRPRLSYAVAMPIVNVGAVLMVDWALRFPASRVGRFLNSGAVSYVGTLSYSLYIWQQLFLDHSRTAPLSRFPLNVACAAAAGMASYYLVERPALRLRARLERRWAPRPPTASDPNDSVRAAAA